MSSIAEPFSACQRARIRRLAAPHEAELAERSGELNIVPYLDIIMNLVVFVMATLSVVCLSTIDSVPPALAGSLPYDRPKRLALTAVITGEGVALKTSGGNVASGCNGMGAGIAVLKIAGGHDLAELGRCARLLKHGAPLDRQVTVTANPDVDYQTVVAVIDALRADREGELFPEVLFGVAP